MGFAFLGFGDGDCVVACHPRPCSSNLGTILDLEGRSFTGGDMDTKVRKLSVPLILFSDERVRGDVVRF